MSEQHRWPERDMILAAVEWWGDDAIEESDCKVVRADCDGGPCLVVLHAPSGRTSDEAADGGRWHTDGTPWGSRDAGT